MKLILASSSPHRADILTNHKISFTPYSSYIKEVVKADLPVNEVVMDLGRQKCLAVCTSEKIAEADDTLVLGADTIVVSSEGQMLQKPKDADQAQEYMQQRSNSYEDVVTGFCLRHHKGIICGSESTRVTYDILPPELQQDILASNEWRGVCGGLKVEGKIASYVKDINGDYDNIRGLPMNRLVPILNSLM